MSTYQIPIFPLSMVVCPEGKIHLRIFEPRYLDMIKSCVKSKTEFVIATILPEGETDADGNYPFGVVGTQVFVSDLDVVTIGELVITCIAQHRVRILSYFTQADGLHVGEVEKIENDKDFSIPTDLTNTAKLLSELLEAIDKAVDRKVIPVNLPYKYHDATWVANRWVELMPMSLVQKYRLMQIESPIIRLELIQDALEAGGVRK